MALTCRRMTESEFLHAVNGAYNMSSDFLQFHSLHIFRCSRSSSIAYSESSVWVFIIVYILNMLSDTPAFTYPLTSPSVTPGSTFFFLLQKFVIF